MCDWIHFKNWLFTTRHNVSSQLVFTGNNTLSLYTLITKQELLLCTYCLKFISLRCKTSDILYSGLQTPYPEHFLRYSNEVIWIKIPGKEFHLGVREFQMLRSLNVPNYLWTFYLPFWKFLWNMSARFDLYLGFLSYSID